MFILGIGTRFAGRNNGQPWIPEVATFSAAEADAMHQQVRALMEQSPKEGPDAVLAALVKVEKRLKTEGQLRALLVVAAELMWFELFCAIVNYTDAKHVAFEKAARELLGVPSPWEPPAAESARRPRQLFDVPGGA